MWRKEGTLMSTDRTDPIARTRELLAGAREDETLEVLPTLLADLLAEIERLREVVALAPVPLASWTTNGTRYTQVSGWERFGAALATDERGEGT